MTQGTGLGQAAGTDAAAPTRRTLAGSFPAEPRSVTEARAMVDRLADRLDAEELAAVRLTVSELVANAVLHTPRARLTVRIGLAGNVVRIEVADHGNGEIAQRHAASDAEHGRGLDLIDAMADSWGVERRPFTVVWAEFSTV